MGVKPPKKRSWTSDIIQSAKEFCGFGETRIKEVANKNEKSGVALCIVMAMYFTGVADLICFSTWLAVSCAFFINCR
ncbi:hypothetical protein CCACVL1_04107 [Corchorus capsularis]|uniref:Uncharacterized protein n=1 Tax=Corchorus capsularis TaxID=210143 RepID=A0A1R3JUY5_COCAP|nr:hypothetical protein CCACVL1_04107 [Corchorus capsularis]